MTPESPSEIVVLLLQIRLLFIVFMVLGLGVGLYVGWMVRGLRLEEERRHDKLDQDIVRLAHRGTEAVDLTRQVIEEVLQARRE